MSSETGCRPGQRVAIVGGGITGLAAANRLIELCDSVDVTVLESASRAGGVLSTTNVDGFCIEAGPDSMLTQLPWGIDLCRRIGFVDQLIGTSREHRQTWIVRSGRLIPLPEGLAIMAPSRIWPTVKSPILSIPGKLRLACERFIRVRPEETDESLADFACRRVGREAFERLVQPLVSGIYMADPTRLSMQAALPRFVAMETQHRSLIRAARHTARKNRSTSTSENGQPQQLPASMFVAPQAGMGSLISALTNCLPSESIRLGATVTNLERQSNGHWRLRIREESGEVNKDFDAVVLATPSNVAAGLVGSSNESLASLLLQIEHSGCIVVTLALNRDQITHPLNGHGFVVPQVEQRDIIACTFSSVKYANRASEDRALLRVFLGGAMRTDLMELDDDAVLRIVLRELGGLLGVRGKPTLTRVVRWPGIMPQYHVGHLNRIEQIENAVASMPGLELAGNSYRGVGIPHCIHSGEQAAQRVVTALAKAP